MIKNKEFEDSDEEYKPPEEVEKEDDFEIFEKEKKINQNMSELFQKVTDESDDQSFVENNSSDIQERVKYLPSVDVKNLASELKEIDANYEPVKKIFNDCLFMSKDNLVFTNTELDIGDLIKLNGKSIF